MGQKLTQEKIRRKVAVEFDCGIIIRNPATRERKKVIISSQSILVSSGLSTIVTVMNIRSGPLAHHSPQIDAGEATLKSVTIKSLNC